MKENNYYTDSYLQEIKKNKILPFVFNDVLAGKEGGAFLKMRIGRGHNFSKIPKITINGHLIEVAQVMIK